MVLCNPTGPAEQKTGCSRERRHGACPSQAVLLLLHKAAQGYFAGIYWSIRIISVGQLYPKRLCQSANINT